MRSTADLLMMCTCNNSKTIMNLARCCNYKQNVNMLIRNVDFLAASFSCNFGTKASKTVLAFTQWDQYLWKKGKALLKYMKGTCILI